MIGIFDIDSLVYEATYNAEDLEEAQESFWGRYNDVQFHMDKRYGSCKIIPVGFCTNNFRKKVDLSYKAQRNSDKPEYFEDLVQHIKDNIDVQMRSGMETDDLVAKFLEHYGSKNSVIISIDKDYMQFECTIFNYRKREFVKVDKEQALYNLYEQMVVGDRADNVLVCKGYGTKWCEKNLYGKNEFGMMRSVFTLYRQLYKGKAREKMLRTFLLLKLNTF
tara:strand:+ start:857 stop:1516 length:660 start_codon:yes stop_codon:yes gene_type:complete